MWEPLLENLRPFFERVVAFFAGWFARGADERRQQLEADAKARKESDQHMDELKRLPDADLDDRVSKL